METRLQRISEKKQRFDKASPLHKDLEKNLREWTRIALTYTSNALEGNTLSHQETALVVEKNMTIGGKSIVEHLEAVNHAHAIDLILQTSKEKTRQELVIEDVLAIHHSILKNIDSTNAGIFRQCSVRIAGSMVPRPNYLKVPELIKDFMHTITTSTDHTAKIAADAHLKFVFIHPFVDGNGRTARLLMNLLLLQDGYPLTIIEKEKRLAYINAIETALLNNKLADYYDVIFEAIEKSLDMYLEAIE
ncbi:MAG: Fic family protein [Candidatus Babeliales bacterium]